MSQNQISFDNSDGDDDYHDVVIMIMMTMLLMIMMRMIMERVDQNLNLQQHILGLGLLHKKLVFFQSFNLCRN